MIRTFTNWLRLDAQNLIAEVWWAVLLLWVALVIFGIMSVASQNMEGGSKAIWIGVIIALPLVGLFAYCVFCLTRVDYYMLDFLFRRKKNTPQLSPISPKPGHRRSP